MKSRSSDCAASFLTTNLATGPIYTASLRLMSSSERFWNPLDEANLPGPGRGCVATWLCEGIGKGVPGVAAGWTGAGFGECCIPAAEIWEPAAVGRGSGAI